MPIFAKTTGLFSVTPKYGLISVTIYDNIMKHNETTGLQLLQTGYFINPLSKRYSHE